MIYYKQQLIDYSNTIPHFLKLIIRGVVHHHEYLTGEIVIANDSSFKVRFYKIGEDERPYRIRKLRRFNKSGLIHFDYLKLEKSQSYVLDLEYTKLKW